MSDQIVMTYKTVSKDNPCIKADKKQDDLKQAQTELFEDRGPYHGTQVIQKLHKCDGYHDR